TPTAGPEVTTAYVLTVTSTEGCPKPVSDTIVVNVIPSVAAFAGNDTTAVIGQPLQLKATGGDSYEWSPSTYLSNAFISNPIATFPGGLDTIVYYVRVSTEQGCSSNDSIEIHLFETKPSVFIPDAITPNGDGLNDILKPTITGMQKFIYFNIYNRWGQLLFSTSQEGQGWDGVYNSRKQPSGTYVYVLSAIDYTGKSYFKKGTFVVIR
ncbi:MAG TPA: gliding motility-associated C-terminal domain-containing protein, partial [Parafilimonas sp.]